MEEPLSKSFARVADDLRTFIDDNLILPDPDAGFSLFVRQPSDMAITSPNPLPKWPVGIQLKHPQEVACFGYLVALDADYHKSMQGDWEAALAMNLTHDLFPIDRQAFTFRPVEVLGIVVGANALISRGSRLHTDLIGILRQCNEQGSADTSSKWMYWLAESILSKTAPPLPRIDDGNLPVNVAAMIYWVLSQPQIRPSVNPDLLLALEDSLLTRTATHGFSGRDLPNASVVLSSLETAVQRRLRSRLNDTAIVASSTSDAIELVKRISLSFPLFARQLQRRRKDVKVPRKKEKQPRPTIVMNDEYDVQDALHAILCLFFDDVRDETWTPSYADNQNRIDFVLPAFEIAIEVKHTGSSLTQRKIADQLIIDKEYYRQDTTCKHLICFVFDPELRLKNPVAIENDLSVGDDKFAVIVIISPKGK